VTLLKRVGYRLTWGGESLIGQQICSARNQALLLSGALDNGNTYKDCCVGLCLSGPIQVVTTQRMFELTATVNLLQNTQDWARRSTIANNRSVSVLCVVAAPVSVSRRDTRRDCPITPCPCQ
jgi:hypothetical protein